MHLLPLKGAIQHYAWGGTVFIPRLLALDNSGHQPFAELWIGAHPSAPARVEINGEPGLDKWIANDPESFLGKEVADRFSGRLPFLFKVLDVNSMLSIQAHPTKKEAEKGFKRENEMGIPLSAPHRNYKDDNHKPEVMVALTDFWLLHGFRPEGEIQRILREVPEFVLLKRFFLDKSLFDLYKGVMELPQEVVDEMLAPLQKRLLKAKKQGKLEKNHPDYWAERAFEDYTTPDGHFDRGIFSIYFFNLVYLKPGEGIFQAAGVPHAYLEGVNIELMANSDNVFRGGLTPKHVDVPELLKHLVFKSVTPEVLSGNAVSSTERVYATPAPDFELSRIDISQSRPHPEARTRAPQALIVIEGHVTVQADDEILERGKGEIFCVPEGVSYLLSTHDEAVLFKATVPV